MCHISKLFDKWFYEVQVDFAIIKNNIKLDQNNYLYISGIFMMLPWEKKKKPKNFPSYVLPKNVESLSEQIFALKHLQK